MPVTASSKPRTRVVLTQEYVDAADTETGRTKRIHDADCPGLVLLLRRCERFGLAKSWECFFGNRKRKGLGSARKVKLAIARHKTTTIRREHALTTNFGRPGKKLKVLLSGSFIGAQPKDAVFYASHPEIKGFNAQRQRIKHCGGKLSRIQYLFRVAAKDWQFSIGSEPTLSYAQAEAIARSLLLFIDTRINPADLTRDEIKNKIAFLKAGPNTKTPAWAA